MKTCAIAVLTVVAMSGAGVGAAQEETALEQALTGFWEAASATESGSARDRVLALTPDFDEVFSRLERGRTYSNKVKRGRVSRTRRNRDGQRHRYFILVPSTYDPARRYPVRVYLHGGVNRPPYQSGDTWWRNYQRLESEDHIAVFPFSWREAFWWEANQEENLNGILEALKREYNLDEDRVFLFGISDGGSGVYYQALRNPTPWAGFLPFIGHIAVALNPRWAEGDFHPPNLGNRPFYVVNGEVDRLYPVSSVEPWIDLLRRAGTEVVFRPQMGLGHEMSWWPREAAGIERFIERHPRRPLGDQLAWESESGDRFNRIDWLEIIELSGEKPAPAVSGSRLFRQTRPFGRVEVSRDGNRISVTAEGVRKYRLLLSPRQFDLTRSVRVETNGRLSFEGSVTPDLETLLEGAARDDDRSRLFASELEIEVGNEGDRRAGSRSPDS